jgi:hypothetical protein
MIFFSKQGKMLSNSNLFLSLIFIFFIPDNGRQQPQSTFNDSNRRRTRGGGR